MARRHRTQRIKPSLNVWKEQRTVEEMSRELQACTDLLKEQRALRKNKPKTTNPEECVVPEKGIVKGGWRYEAKLLCDAAKRIQQQ